jgi:signal transduction histidine kinase
MTTLGHQLESPVEVAAAVPHAGKVSPAELAELIGAFNEVTDRLHATHRQLHAEVGRLTQELRQANEQLERSRRLAALGEMAAGIAHEVRNPLGSIRLYARMLLEDLADRPQERQTVAKIDAGAVGLAAIVEDLLMFAREFKIRRDEMTVRELYDAALEACREDCTAGLDAVRFDVLPGHAVNEEPIVVAVDRGLMVRVLVNVIRNAVQAMTENDSPVRKITLDAARAVATETCSEKVVLIVRDTGPGVPESVAQRMFNPFFTTRETGTGLGLAIVHRIIEGHGGQVSLASAKEGTNGAVVRITLAPPSGGENESAVVVIGK